ncbi:unnamed protein product [Pylaiella littoralis]
MPLVLCACSTQRTILPRQHLSANPGLACARHGNQTRRRPWLPPCEKVEEPKLLLRSTTLLQTCSASGRGTNVRRGLP